MRAFLILPVLALAGCTSPSLQGIFGTEPVQPVAAPAPTLDPTPPPPPPTTATTVDQFDTTTQEDRDAATAVDESDAGEALGTTIASLGSPTDPGIWLETPLVDELTPGRVAYQGTEINIELRPSGGAPGSGSQISLAAMRLLNAPLTGLPEIEVFTR
ncbi:D-galactarate dehydratase [Cognatiyoonia sp. IB215446]|uniref:D-galactarate dehydratase n=1 Tax=Cognatiyoonia sp. IB215446 TaxID=3097355 RepID=UPI002A11B98D|nr:D-galactarate dehydratase [Cognatiyoonia sp. IB215446]MDX8349507.1 D-galactarate dehydratase [Cognatiyoonia sp. IB215446]